MVMVGGATRLTDSGLSLTRWEVVRGILPPLTGEEWQAYFEAYQQIPQYKALHFGMSLTAFKTIFWWEWGHRFLGRFIGIAYALPLLWFWKRDLLPQRVLPHLLIVLGLGAAQGGIGWWMVQSGLIHRIDVSPLRLAVHLLLAGLILSYLLWIIQNLQKEQGWRTQDPSPQKSQEKHDSQIEVYNDRSLYLSVSALCILALCFLQIFLGGLVAGLNAGQSFTTWPLMDGRWIPEGLFVLSPFWRNFYENALLVQFQHRSVGSGVCLLILIHSFWLFRTPLPASDDRNRRRIRHTGLLLAVLALVQTILGILTLLHAVPITLALFHQAFAFLLLGGAVVHSTAFVQNPRFALKQS